MKHSKPLLANTVAAIGSAIGPGTITAGNTANGAAIVEPWVKARQLVFHLLGGSIAGTVSFALEARERGTSNWVAVNDPKGQAIVLSGSRYDSGGQMEDGHVLATCLLNRLGTDSTTDFRATYDALRLTATAAGGAADLGVAYSLFDADIEPADTPDVNDDMAGLMLVGRTD